MSLKRLILKATYLLLLKLRGKTWDNDDRGSYAATKTHVKINDNFYITRLPLGEENVLSKGI